jgi:murein DD-endopeptidase MepM/ murein hydrolase activator NlpD
MDIIVVSSREGQMRRYSLEWRRFWVWLPFVLLFGGSMAAAGAFGYWLRAPGATLPHGLIANWSAEVEQQRAALEETRLRAGEEARALARRVAQLQAHVLRLEAVGARLTQVAGLEAGEFDFGAEPSLGGPEVAALNPDIEFSDVFSSLQAFERKLTDRERQLRVLEDLVVVSRLQNEVQPSGWPVRTGWISSVFGMRTDPFTGRRAIHEGIDFAAREGTSVQAVGAGIVTFSGVRSGYGKIVEVNHGNGYVTRYSHNQRNLVREGERVYKGHPIATVGSSGRSTGPHLHFEVLYNGRVVNPQKYIQAAR